MREFEDGSDVVRAKNGEGEGFEGGVARAPNADGVTGGWESHLLQVLHSLNSRFGSICFLLVIGFGSADFDCTIFINLVISTCLRGGRMSSSKLLKWRVVLRAFMLVFIVLLLCLMQMGHEIRVIEPFWDSDGCSSPENESNLTGILDSGSNFALPLFGSSPAPCEERENFTGAVFRILMEKNLLQSDARVLCVGEKSASAVLALRHLGFFNVFGVERHPFFSLLKRGFAYDLSFDDNHFDFVFLEDLDRVSAPSLMVMEMERVLRPGGTGSLLLRRQSRLVFLKRFDLVHVSDVGSFALMAFNKRLDTFASFHHFHLPTTCPSIERNKPFMKNIEPLIDPKLSYLPESMNISTRNKLIYINLGAGEYAKTSISKMSKPYCSNHHSSFEVFIIDHKTSVLSSLVMDSGINFVYLPSLAGDNSPPEISSDEFLTAPMEEQGFFDFVPWFKETVSDRDFVVLLTKAEPGEMNILVGLFESGAICHVDEVFLRCSEDCTNLLESLRKSGVYAHRWLGD